MPNTRSVARGYLAFAALLGLVGFVVNEFALYFRRGYYLSSSLETVLLALAFASSALLCALAFKKALRWARGWRLLVVAPAYFTLFVILAGLVGALLQLTALGRWGALDELRMMLLTTPTFVLEDLLTAWFVSFPLGFVSLWLLGRASR